MLGLLTSDPGWQKILENVAVNEFVWLVWRTGHIKTLPHNPTTVGNNITGHNGCLRLLPISVSFSMEMLQNMFAKSQALRSDLANLYQIWVKTLIICDKLCTNYTFCWINKKPLGLLHSHAMIIVYRLTWRFFRIFRKNVATFLIFSKDRLYPGAQNN